MPDLLDVAEALHREAHAEKAPPRLAQCPFHDPDAIALRARGLVLWYFEPSAARSNGQ